MTQATPEASLNYGVFSLHSIAEEGFEVLNNRVKERLEQFECAASPHIEAFARKKVSNYEQHEHSRTYVLIIPVDEDDIDVAGFFSIGMTTLDFRGISKSQRRKLSGNFSEVETTGAYAITELARSDNYTSAQLPGWKILDEAKNIISLARRHIAGRYVMVDAQPAIFEHLYQPAGFSVIGDAPSPRDMPDIPFVSACAKVKDW